MIPCSLVRRVIAFTALLLATIPRPAAAEWRSLRSEHFQIIGDVSQGQLRDVALQFEQFHEVVTQLIPSALRGGSPPVVVIVFPDQRSHGPFMPRVNGRTVPVAGMFLGGQDVNYITVSLEAGHESFAVVFHEYSHLLLRGVFANAPLWFNEGLAEYYSTFEVANGGRTARIGKPIARHVQLLRERRMPLSQLFSISPGSKEYTTEGLPRSLLYAQSWAVVHHALHDETRRREQLIGFAQRLAAGGGLEDSLRATYALPLDQLDGEVQAYVRRQIYQHLEVDFTKSLVTKVTGNAVRLADAEVDAWLGDFLVHQRQRDSDAEALLAKSLKARPDLAQAHAALGLLRWRQGKYEEALPSLAKASAASTSNEVAHFTYAYALATDGARDAAGLADAALALEKAISLRPGYPAAQRLLGYVYLQRDEYAKVRDLLGPMVKISPGDHDAALILAAGLLGLNDMAGARALLGPILAASPDEDARRQARTLLGQIATVQNRSQAGSSRPSVAAPSLEQRTESTATDARSSSQPSVILPLRPLRPGEQRTYGIFQAIVCSEKGVVLVLQGPTGTVRASAASFPSVEFTTFRSQTGGSVSCGPQPAVPALLTWRSEADSTVAVAIELVPDGYVP